MERSWSGGFSWSQVNSSSFKLESALRGRSQPGVSFRNWSQPGVNLRKVESTCSQPPKADPAISHWSPTPPAFLIGATGAARGGGVAPGCSRSPQYRHRTRDRRSRRRRRDASGDRRFLKKKNNNRAVQPEGRSVSLIFAAFAATAAARGTPRPPAAVGGPPPPPPPPPPPTPPLTPTAAAPAPAPAAAASSLSSSESTSRSSHHAAARAFATRSKNSVWSSERRSTSPSGEWNMCSGSITNRPEGCTSCGAGKTSRKRRRHRSVGISANSSSVSSAVRGFSC